MIYYYDEEKKNIVSLIKQIVQQTLKSAFFHRMQLQTNFKMLKPNVSKHFVKSKLIKTTHFPACVTSYNRYDDLWGCVIFPAIPVYSK